MDKAKRHAKRTFIAIAGTLVVLVGIVAIPYPGPGWLIVFAGLAILATEFAWAQRVLDRARRHYDAWVAWIEKRSLGIRFVVLLLTSCVVMITVWLVNGFGIFNSLFHLGQDWLQSPFV
jgi:uncharacterized protein (TIGR02611 family)